jgi:hypothetical protein
MAGAICVGAFATAVGGGVWAGRAAAPGERVDPAATRVVRAGVASLEVPRAWRTIASRDAGAAAGTTAVLAPSSGLPNRVIVTVAPPDDRSLVPRALRGLVRDLGRGPRATRLGGYRAWQYAGLLGRNRTDVLDVTVLPSSAGVLGVACTSALWLADATADCASSIGSVSIGGAAVFVPSPDLALRLRLPRVLAALDGTRVRSRAALGRAGSRGGQARLARRLARAHLAAAASLRPAAGRTGAPLIEELSNISGAYSELERAASTGSPSRFRAARGTVQAAEVRLAEATDRLVSHGEREAVAAEPTRSSSRRPAVGTAETPSIVLLIGMLLGLLAIGLMALRSRGSPAWAASRIGPRDRGRWTVRARALRSRLGGRVPAASASRDERSPLLGVARSADPPAPTAARSEAAVRRGRALAGPSARWDAPPTPLPGPSSAGVGPAGPKAASGPVSTSTAKPPREPPARRAGRKAEAAGISPRSDDGRDQATRALSPRVGRERQPISRAESDHTQPKSGADRRASGAARQIERSEPRQR